MCNFSSDKVKLKSLIWAVEPETMAKKYVWSWCFYLCDVKKMSNSCKKQRCSRETAVESAEKRKTVLATKKK